MLSGSNNNKLIAKHVDVKVIPFYQIWQELVHEQTLDVYQYRVLTSLNIFVQEYQCPRKSSSIGNICPGYINLIPSQ